MKNLSFVLACAALTAAVPAYANTPASWNGATANWSTAANWSTTPQVPNNNTPAGALYDVTITAGQITLDTNPTIQQLTWANGTLTTGNLSVKGGMTLGGSVDYLGTAAGTATLTNAAGQTTTLGAGGITYLELGNASAFNNAGTFSALSGGVFNSGSGGTFNNTGSFTVNLASTGSFFNTGNGIAFNNTGAVTVQNGTFVVAGDAGNTTGSFQIAATGALNLNGNFTFASSATIAGAGYLNFVTGTSTFKGAAPISVPKLNFAGGTITAPGSLGISSNITWSGGTFANALITLSGNTSIAGMQAVYVSAATVTLAANTTNSLGASGNITLNLQNAATFSNAGILALSNGSVANNGGGGVFNNSGTTTCTLPAGNAFTVGAGVTFNNSGNVSVTSGTFSVDGGDTGATTGKFSVAANATVRFSANMTLTANASVSGSGTLDVAAGTTTLAQGLTGLHALSVEGTLVNAANGATAGTSFLPALTIGGSPGAWTGKLNLGANKLIVEPSAATKSTALAALQNQVNFGKTANLGIVGAGLPAGQGLAVVDNGALSVPRLTFGGVTVDANSLLVGPALLGDANFDNKVDLNDLNTILNHLGQTTPTWTNGNFDGAATIDLNDLNFTLNNLGATITPGVTGVAFAQSLTGTATPEPTSLGLLLLAAPLFLRNPRRHV